ncbi:hypothetical protein GGTG_10771 [Gaeumannomyces tritici R3-111a-1]|uniref:DUF4219 domain-containing protein n=1 Tax=Gaeumannomyces tritici (strain R3-111a-1) TaxID=644352 RepID=J3PB98_GAET3|nr:hypothetical protein GGTG_10771 [Gaeumannomyces tritici R3-111a-1]EJT71514.1 hypothetical protein GGTG_10771 [Gaeumannomyces tritici R3-111a-1]
MAEIPELLGPCNFEAWKRTVRAHLAATRSAAFISANPPARPAGDEDSEEVSKWLARRTMAWWRIRSSIDKVVVHLEMAGWKPAKDDDDQDPKALWDKVVATISEMAHARVHVLIKEYLSMTVEKYGGDVKKYAERWFQVRQAMDQAGFSIPDERQINNLIHGLGTLYPNYVAVALDDHKGERRTPANLISAVFERVELMSSSATINSDNIDDGASDHQTASARNWSGRQRWRRY